MKLSNYIEEKFMTVNLKSKTKEEAIKEMINKIAKFDPGVEAKQEDIISTVFARENEISTAMGNGIAVPHGRVAGYEDIIVAIGISKDGIESQIASLPIKDNVHLFFLIIAGQTKNKLILKLMASVSKLVSKKGVIDKLLECDNFGDFLRIVKENEASVKENITAEDIMNNNITPVNLGATLEEVATRLIKEKTTGLPVVDDFGKFVGEITERELISYGMPKYTMLLDNLDFMTTGEPFEKYFKDERTVTVKDLYRENMHTVRKTDSIMTVSFEMLNKGRTRVYVVEDGKFYGMILRSDIIKKVLHI